MGINEKIPDCLLSIRGEDAQLYAQPVKKLLNRELPDGWQWVSCSKETLVSCTNENSFVFYKEFLPRNKFEKIKSLLRGSRCTRARKQAEILLAAGLPTPKILCWGKGEKNEFLISEGFAGIGFFKFLQTNFTPPLQSQQLREKRKLLEQVGNLIGRLHNQGIVHGDLRPNNLLTLKTDHGFLFNFIDNESNRKWRRIPLSQIQKNLVQFTIIPDNLLSRTDFLRFFRAYSAVFPRFSPTEKRKLLLTVYTESQSRIEHYKNKINQIVSSQNYSGVCKRKSGLPSLFSSGITPEEWFRKGIKTLKSDKQIRVNLLQLPDGRLVVVKRLLLKKIWHHAKAIYREERSLTLWKMSHAFQEQGLPVPAPLGYVIEKKDKSHVVQYFYCQYLPNMNNLNLIVLSRPDTPDWLTKNNIIPRLAKHIAQLHNAGICHGDMKWANILANEENGDLYFIDLDDASQADCGFNRAMKKDIGRFLVDTIEFNLPECFSDIFLSEYCGERGLEVASIKKEIKPIIRKILRRHAKHREKTSAPKPH